MTNRCTVLFAFFWLGSLSVMADLCQQVSSVGAQQDTVLPGSDPLAFDKDLSYTLLNEAHGFADKKMAESAQKRGQYWKRDFTSRSAYETSVEPNRKRLRKAIGIDERGSERGNYNLGLPDPRPQVGMERFAYDRDSILVAETSKYRVYQVRWPVLSRISGEGLLLEPKNKATGSVIAIPDADQTPEQLAGLAAGIAPQSQFARHLAENGLRVLVPVLIDRSPVFPGETKEQTKREWLYRQSYHMGKHLIGFEVQKVLAAVDWFKQTYGSKEKIGVAGYLEGGLIAFYAAAVDPRIDVTLVSGYFQSRENVWNEPIYRNVWGLLNEFGDAEMATLIAPRALIVEYSATPEIWDGKRQDPTNLYNYSGYKGHLKTPDFENVSNEFKRINQLLKPDFQFRELVAKGKNAPIGFGSVEALRVFCEKIGKDNILPLSGETPKDQRGSFKPADRQFRQAKEIDDHVQWLLRVSDYERNSFFLYKVIPEIGNRTWSTKTYHPYYPVEPFIEKSKPYRTIFQKEIIGEFDDELTGPSPRTRKIYDTVKWTGYEVVLKVFDGLSAAGILLIPKDIRPDEKRPVVVVQHGRNGVPATVIEGNTSYNDIGARLADQGFVVFAPFGIYNGEDRYRWLGRKANTLQKTMFSFVLAQHRQILNWLPTLSYVDKNRIAFYGKSYGGEMAMRIPSILEGYCLSVCSGDFGDWSRKVTDTYWHNSFMNTIEWEMPYFNMGSTFSYAEMAYLVAPRPFMVERGHDDLVQPDEWVAYEYAKVKYLYDRLNLGDKTDIEYFNGGHVSRNEGVFKFLHKHLNWP
ncbi:dienelactone hydrolase family protein [Dyadobacter bucti]|uniref:alpha/beta hydrolase family protein n=1 Tax=Dyadobacter bucti TaxID=2572203 RepID=UPI003F709CD1